jgi:thioesterase domain-containing protein/acyl carrier protein
VASFIPRDHVDEVVMDQFKQALEIDRIAADVSFFDMGGDSLMALRLFAAVEEALGVSLPLASLFEHPTVGAFGSVVRNTVNRGRTSTFSAVPGPNVVEIKSGRSRAPLFLVPGGSGGRTDMALYAQMMVHLRGEHRVYGLRVDQIGGTSAHRESIEKRAEACTAEIRRIQPHGPYALGGECVGGVVAFEIAQQLAAAGEEVALLALFDAWLPLSADRTRSKVFGPMRSMAVSMMSVFRLGMANIQRELDRNTGGADLEQSMSWIDMAATFKRKGLSGVRNLKRIAGSVRGAAFTLDQVMRYRPKHYRGPVTLICSSEWERLGAPRQWERVAGDALVVHTLPGAHESYIRSSPEAAARLLERCLEEIPEVDR